MYVIHTELKNRKIIYPTQRRYFVCRFNINISDIIYAPEFFDETDRGYSGQA